MSKIFLLAMFFTTTWCSAQKSSKPEIADAMLVSIWNEKTQEFDKLSFEKDLYIPIYFLSDRIRIILKDDKKGNQKDDKMDFYTRGKSVAKTEGNIMITEWDCKDKLGRNCSVGVLFGKEPPFTTIVAVTYSKSMQFCYWLKEKKDYKRLSQ